MLANTLRQRVFYPILRATSRQLSSMVPLIHKLRLNRYWAFLLKLLPRDGGFVKSVYGPYLKERHGDHQFYLCATGKSGFKLADLIHELARKTVFIDVGANLGLYSIIASRNKGVSKVISIEPNPTVISDLKINIAFNRARNVSVWEGAVSGSSTTVELRYDDWHLGMGSIERSGRHSVTVKSYNRDAFTELFSSICEDVFVKIDVEGAECAVLEEIFAARNTNIIKYVFVEITPKWISQEDVESIFTIMRLNGFKLDWRSSGKDQYDAFFVKEKNYQFADILKKKRAQSIEVMPRYSVCIPNYNMSDTIYSAISSVAEQLDNQYEILIIDDGSTDKSQEEIQRLERDYPIVRSIFLSRDKNRQLGETRNFSIYSALGEYVLLHIDADDQWEAYLQDLVRIFHCLELAYKYDFLLVGQQTGIAKRQLMLSSGGYENIYRGEDRNLMFNLAAQDKILFLDYKTFRRRLDRPTKKKYIKVVWDMWSHLEYDLTYGEQKFNYILVAMLLSYNNPDFTFKTRLLRAIMILPASARSMFIEKRYVAMNWKAFLEYRESRRGSFESLMAKAGKPTKLSDVVAGKAEKIFGHRLSSRGFKGE